MIWIFKKKIILSKTQLKNTKGVQIKSRCNQRKFRSDRLQSRSVLRTLRSKDVGTLHIATRRRLIRERSNLKILVSTKSRSNKDKCRTIREINI